MIGKMLSVTKSKDDCETSYKLHNQISREPVALLVDRRGRNRRESDEELPVFTHVKRISLVA